MDYFVKRLELVGYERMSLNGMHRFVITPSRDKPVQLILGTNGCGKSSLMHELFPLPADKDDFSTDGRKDIEIEFSGKVYRLISTFDPKQSHSFDVDGVNLNPSGLVTIQKALVQEHFGITPEIRDLILGQEKFTHMSPTRRRGWFTALSPVDFSYSIKTFAKLKENHRDIQGALKTAKHRLVTESGKCLDSATIATLQSETKSRHATIRELYERKPNRSEKPEDVVYQIRRLEEQLLGIHQEVERVNLDSRVVHTYTDQASIEQRISALREDEVRNKALSQKIYADHGVIKKKYDILVKSGRETIQELRESLSTIKQTIALEEIKCQFPIYAVVGSAKREQDYLLHVDEIQRLLLALPNNSDGHYSREALEKTRQSEHQTQQDKEKLFQKRAALVAKRDHALTHKDAPALVCPKCDHRWSKVFIDQDWDSLNTQIGQVELDLNKNAETAVLIQADLKDYETYLQGYREIVQLFRGVSSLEKYWNFFTSDKALITSPKKVYHNVNRLREELAVLTVIEKLSVKRDEIASHIEMKESVDVTNLDELEKDLERLERELSTLSHELQTITTELRNLTTTVGALNGLTVKREQITQLLERRETFKQQYVEARLQTCITECIHALQIQVARTEDVLASVNIQAGVVDDLTRQIEELTVKERVAQVLLYEMSPTSGLIAEGIFGFINNFTDRMNTQINKIWTYPLEIEPCSFDPNSANELDYKFPVLRNEEGSPLKDVRQGSEGMLDVFNFAFTICALRQLGLSYLPLHFDEFGRTFDDLHRAASMTAVKEIIEENGQAQTFIISHYESNHGALTHDAEVCVIDGTNLLLPENAQYNQHVEMQ